MRQFDILVEILSSYLNERKIFNFSPNVSVMEGCDLITGNMAQLSPQIAKER